MATVWTQEAWFHGGHANVSKVFSAQPSGNIGWNTSEVPLIGELKVKHAYAVKVIYSTGSTFGIESGLVAVAAVCATDEQAIRVTREIEENASLASPQYTITVDGVDIYCGTWTGYFESVEAVIIEFVEVVDLP